MLFQAAFNITLVAQISDDAVLRAIKPNYTFVIENNTQFVAFHYVASSIQPAEYCFRWRLFVGLFVRPSVCLLTTLREHGYSYHSEAFSTHCSASSDMLLSVGPTKSPMTSDDT